MVPADAPAPRPAKGESAPPSAVRAATGAFLTGALVSLAFLAFSLYRFEVSLTRGPVTWYLLFAFLGGGCAWCAYRLQPARRVVAAVVGLTVAATLYASEAALALTAHVSRIRVQARLAARTGVPIDTRPLPDVVRDLRSNGVDAVPSVVPAVILAQAVSHADRRLAWTSAVLPLGGISRRPTVHLCNEDGQYRRYASDEHGFTNPAGAWSDAAREIVLIGDSFTHGYCLDADRTYAAHLRRRWPSLVNLGTGGSGPLVELATLAEYAAALRPRVLVWQYFENDLENLAQERQFPVLLRYLEPAFSQHLRNRQRELDDAMSAWVERGLASGRGYSLAAAFRWREVVTLYGLRDLAASWLSRRTHPSQEEIPLFREVLRQAVARVAGWNGRLVFVFVPQWERYYQPAALAGRDLRDAVLAAAGSLGIQVVDLEPVVRGHTERAELFARRELATAHFSELGHALLAREVGEAISRAGTAGAR